MRGEHPRRVHTQGGTRGDGAVESCAIGSTVRREGGGAAFVRKNAKYFAVLP